MGQYFKCVNVDTGEHIRPRDYDQGAKLMEHSWTITSFMKVAENLLKPGGKWHKTRIVWTGDYMDEGLFLDDIPEKVKKRLRLETLFQNEEVTSLYGLTYDHFPSLTEVEQNEEKEFVYVLNHSKKEYVDLTKLPLTGTWVDPNTREQIEYYVHPLSLLTSSGNGEGGGDYGYSHGEEYVGSWAGDVISLEKEMPKDFKEIQPNFRETND